MLTEIDWLPCEALPSSKHNLWRYLPLPGRGSDQITAPNYIKLQELAKASHLQLGDVLLMLAASF